MLDALLSSSFLRGKEARRYGPFHNCAGKHPEQGNQGITTTSRIKARYRVEGKSWDFAPVARPDGGQSSLRMREAPLAPALLLLGD